jgi:hypothetical protein
MLAMLSAPSLPRIAALLAAAAVVLVPAVFPLVTRADADVSYENRRPSGIPDSALSWNDQIQGYQRYFEDRIGWRREFIAIRNRLSHAIGLSPNPQARVGKEGWLFTTNAMALVNRAGLVRFDDKTTRRLRAQFDARAQFWDQRSISYYFMLGPDKSSIYPEQLDSLFPIGETAFDRIYHLHGKGAFGSRFIDPRDRLRGEVSAGVYFRTDSHWNVIGGRVAYDFLIDRLAEEHPEIPRVPIAGYRSTTRLFKGDLVPAGLEATYADREDYILPDAGGCGRQLSLPKLAWAGYAPSFEPAWTKCEGGRLNALIVHDSFGIALQPYLARTFAQAMFFWTPRGEEVPGELLEQANSIMGHVDVIIHERVERAFLKGTE